MANSSTSNNSYSYQFNQNNCGKRRRTLASEMDQTSREMDLIRDKFNLQNSLMEQFNENKRIVDANNKLNELLEKTKIEKEIYKNENEKNLKEMSKLQKEYLNQFNGQSELINKNTVISIKLDFMRTKMLKREKEKELNLIEMCKLKKENEKFKEENEYLENEKTKVAEELKDLKNNFTKLKEENEVNKKEMIKLKEENELNIKEKNKIQKEMFNLNKEKKVFIDANNQRLIEIKFLNSDMEKLKKESDEKMKKMSEESLKLNKENEKILKEKIQLIKERENFRIEIFKIKGEMNLNIKNLAEYKKGSYVGIGFYNITTRLSINNSSNTLWNVGEDELTCYESSWKDKDVFGCGVVFPSWKDNKVLPYMFFTKNGEIIGKKFPLSEEDDNLRPFFELLSCSIEINFGNDLVNKPFRYNIYNHI
uniref:SPRY domain-containing protein n=1 Tax=Meloidogyne hapla TaxID=6305 RepID=A0A1I8B5M9_MELHA